MKRLIRAKRVDPIVGYLSIAVSYWICVWLVRDISGGVLNPGLAIAQIMWQNMSWRY